MIDWNIEMEKAIIEKDKNDEKIRLELEAKKLEEQRKLEISFNNNKIFDNVVAEEIEGIKTLLKSTGHEYQLIVTSGSVEVRKIDRIGGCTGWTNTSFNIVSKEGTDLATLTRERLAKFVTWILLYWDKR